MAKRAASSQERGQARKEEQANWLPAPEGQFALILRAYVPTQPILDGSYELPNVQRK